MLRQLDDGLAEIRRNTRYLSSVPEWSLVVVSALIQTWEILMEHFADVLEEPLKVSAVAGQIISRLQRPIEIGNVSFVPSVVPLKRRLQVLCLFFHGFFGIFAPAAIVYSLYCMFVYTDWLKPVPVLYLAWYFYSADLPNVGGRSFLLGIARKSFLYKSWTSYFPIKLIKTADLDPSKNYLFGSHPHGLLCFGAFACFATDNDEFKELFPGLFPRLLTLLNFYYIPGVREILLSCGCLAATKRGMDYLLGKTKGTVAVLVVGGARETLNAPRQEEVKLILKERKGFVKMALRNGTAIVPTFSFGETGIYNYVPNPPGSRMRRFQDWFQKHFLFPPAMFNGRGLFQYSFGLMPHRRPINVVVGAPIEVAERIAEPTAEDVERLHAEYVDALTRLYEKYNPIYGNPKMKLVID